MASPSKKSRPPGLTLDLTLTNSEIEDTLGKLNERSYNNTTSCTEIAEAEADPADCVRVPEDIIHLGIRNVAVDDRTVYAMVTAYKRRDCGANKFDFEQTGLVRGVRPPRGLGVAVEAFGIRWIPEIYDRTLLTGIELTGVFTYLTRTERPSGSPPAVRIGRVTIPTSWVEGVDYQVVAKPRKVNCAPDAPDNRGYSDIERYTRELIRHAGWPNMDLDPNRKVIVPSCREPDKHKIIRMQDVPGFRVHCADPATIAPGEENQAYDQSDPRLDAGLWEILAHTRWTMDPLQMRPPKRAQNASAEEPGDLQKASADKPKEPKDARANKPKEPEGASANKPKALKNASVDQLKALKDAIVKELEALEKASATGPEGSTPQVTPQEPAATDPAVKDTLPPEIDIYKIVAVHMATPIVDRGGAWEPPCGLNGPDVISFAREISTTVKGSCAKVLRDVAKAAGEINEYLKGKGWSQEQAARKEATDVAFAALVKQFVDATKTCDETIKRIRESRWRAIALANYLLVGLQYPCIAINDSLRRPAIPDISAFLAMNPMNFDAASVRQTSKDAAGTDSPEYH